MITLNDDCQLLIIKNLCLKDQLALFEAAKEEPTNRWNSNLRYNWQHQLSFSLDAGVFTYFAKNLEVLDDFLANISPTVQQLDLQSITLDNLNCLIPYKFPKMMSVKYSLERNEAQCNEKQFTKLVAELFSGLENVKPYSVIDCVHLKNFKSLRKLELSGSWWIRWSYQEFNCELIGDLKSLEELIIPGNIFKDDIYKVIMRLPKLRSLTSYEDGGRFVETLLDKGIEELTFCESLCSVTTQTYKRLTNLRKLTIINESKYPGECLYQEVTNLPRLEHLDIVDSPIFPSEIDLWNVVACCPSLKILNISSTDLGDDFFNISRRPMNKALDTRSTPLTLLCHDIRYADQIRLYFKHPNLNVSFERIKKYHIDWMALIDQYFCTIKFSALDNEKENS